MSEYFIVAVFYWPVFYCGCILLDCILLWLYFIGLYFIVSRLNDAWKEHQVKFHADCF